MGKKTKSKNKKTSGIVTDSFYYHDNFLDLQIFNYINLKEATTVKEWVSSYLFLKKFSLYFLIETLII
jgi:hypothetical protein